MKRVVVLFLSISGVFVSSCARVHEFAVADDYNTDEVCFFLSLPGEKKNGLKAIMKGIAKEREENEIPLWLGEASEKHSGYCLIYTVNSKRADFFLFFKEAPFSIKREGWGGEEYFSIEEYFTPSEKERMYKLIPEWKSKGKSALRRK